MGINEKLSNAFLLHCYETLIKLVLFSNSKITQKNCCAKEGFNYQICTSGCTKCKLHLLKFKDIFLLLQSLNKSAFESHHLGITISLFS
jgi:hypothetical protein